jgi:hypothetical protein
LVKVLGIIAVTPPQRLVVYKVSDRCTNTLRQYFQISAAVGNRVTTDGWRGYLFLAHEGWRHGPINHLHGFVCPVTGFHTNTIERQWRDMKSYCRDFLPLSEPKFEVFLYDWLYRKQRLLEGKTNVQIVDDILGDLF